MGEKLKKSPVEKKVLKEEKKTEKSLKKRLKHLRNKHDHYQVRVATTAPDKQDGMSDPYIRGRLDQSYVNLEYFGYSEPERSVFATVESKALAALILHGLARAEDFTDVSLKFDQVKKDEIVEIPKGKEVLFDVMDAGTKVNGRDIFKLTREHPNYRSYSQEEAKNHLDEDKKIMEKDFLSDFEVEFEGSRGIVSSKGKIANGVAGKYTVKFRALTQELIDEAYQNPRVWSIGPRVNLAMLVSQRPDLVKSVVGVDLHDPDLKSKVLEPSEYHKVTDLIVYGKVDDKTMLELLKKTKRPRWQSMGRSRINI
jgi:hypothetical protein